MRRRRHPPRPLLGWAIAAGAAACALGCRSVVDPPLPTGAVRVTPPAVYARWWAMTEACAGVRRDVAEIAWYVVPNVGTFPSPSGGGEAVGYYSRPGSQIVLGERRHLEGGTVRHEMLHALLRDESGHPRRAFLEQCAGVVRCEADCVRDAGAPPTTAGVSRLRTDDLVLAADLTPVAGAGTPGADAWYTLTVTATNPVPSPVEVALAPLSFAPNFGYVVTTDPPRAPQPGEVTAFSYHESTYDVGVTRFAAGETKRYVFDLHVQRHPAPGMVAGGRGGDLLLAPGAYLFRGSYGDGGGRSPAVAATLAP